MKKIKNPLNKINRSDTIVSILIQIISFVFLFLNFLFLDNPFTISSFIFALGFIISLFWFFALKEEYIINESLFKIDLSILFLNKYKEQLTNQQIFLTIKNTNIETNYKLVPYTEEIKNKIWVDGFKEIIQMRIDGLNRTELKKYRSRLDSLVNYLTDEEKNLLLKKSEFFQ